MKQKKLLIPFITAGDPSLEVTEELIYTLEKAGADIIELGIPFSDPMADGPVIQQASERALAQGVTLDKVLDLVKKVRKKTKVPLVLMGYYNPIFIMGVEVFAKKAATAGVTGLLIVDLPPEEAEPLKKALKKQNVDLIFLLAPTSTDDRIQKVSRLASGYVYYVSLTGVTGAALKISTDIEKQVHRIQKKTGLPVVVGFGIRTPEDAQKIAKMADGVVIGSALVSLIQEYQGQDEERLKAVFDYVRKIRAGMDGK